MAAWTVVAERGSVLGMWLTVGFYRVFGRRLSEFFVLPIVAYFFVTDRAGRRASRQYLARVHATPEGAEALGRPPGLRDSFRHYREFATSTLDRLRFVLGDVGDVPLEFQGRELLGRLLAERRGALILGAHLGNFDALRLLAARGRIVVNVVMFTRHAPRINAVLQRLNPETDARVIEVDPTSPSSVLRLRECVQRGEFVAILGDRVGDAARVRVSRVPFLGAPAAFPQGPFILAHALQCPVLLMLALRRGTSYEVVAELLAEQAVLPRGEREGRLHQLIAAYARRLEAHCLSAPFQWFNFYDFWAAEAS
jgi:predicted LPLAT superfamily acyltransferase